MQRSTVSLLRRKDQVTDLVIKIVDDSPNNASCVMGNDMNVARAVLYLFE